MKTLLIPVDFTPTTDNAIAFGVEWCKKYEYERIILLRSFYNNVFDQIVVSAEYAPVSQDYMKQEREETRERLEEITLQLATQLGPHFKIVTALSEASLLRSIMEVIHYEQPDMILLGSDNYDYSGDSFIAGNIISIAKISPIRVLIVPVTYSYQPIRTALVPCDFNALESLDKLNSLRTSPSWENTNLQVLNVDAKQRYLNHDATFHENEHKLHEYLKNFSHTIHYSNDRNIIDGILNFTKTNLIQLIIAMPGKYSFLYSLTHKSISKGIYQNAKEPVLILK